jgi:hypothetical protein
MRKVASAVNLLLRNAVQKDGAAIYTAPTISDPPTQAEVQAIADAVQALSGRLECSAPRSWPNTCAGGTILSPCSIPSFTRPSGWTIRS